jgi:hypothetical protein
MNAAVSKLIETSRAHLMGVDVDESKADVSRVNACIEEVMKRFPRTGPASQAKYYEEVHQHLGPLARDLEREVEALTTALAACRDAVFSEPINSHHFDGAMSDPAEVPGYVKDQVETLRASYAAAVQDAERAREERNRIGVEIRGEWMAKCETLRKDAERYRHIRSGAEQVSYDGGFRAYWRLHTVGAPPNDPAASSFDGAIDAAVASKGGV